MLRFERDKLAVMAIDLNAVHFIIVIGIRPLDVCIRSGINQLHLARFGVKVIQAFNTLIAGVGADDS